MPRYLLEFEVESSAALVPEVNELAAQSTDGELQVTVSVSRADPGDETTLLFLDVVMSADSIDDAIEQGPKQVRNFLQAWSFATSVPFRIKQLHRVADWTIGLTERTCVQFTEHAGYDRPYNVLNGETLISAVRLTTGQLPARIRRAVRWFSNGISSDYSDDQFYYFWLALESVAVELKSPEPVPDRCAKCKAPLYCESCKTHPLHKPYPKQAIQALFQKHVRDKPEEFFGTADRLRNALMHGDELEEVRIDTGHDFDFIVDKLGQLAWAVLLNYFTANPKCVSDSEKQEVLPLLQTNTFTHGTLRAGTDRKSTRLNSSHPRLSRMPSSA